MKIFEVGHFDHIPTHELATQSVNHVVVVKGHKQGVAVEKQAKLRQVKINVLRAIHPTHDKDVGRIYPVAVFQQQEILYEQGILCGIGGNGGITRRVGLIWVELRTQVLVDVDIDATHSEHFLDVAVKILVVVGSVGSVKAEPRHSHVFMGQLSQWAQSPDNYMHG